MPDRSSSRAGLLALVLGLAALALPAAAQKVRIECLSFPKQAEGKIELLVAPEKTVDVTLQSHAFADPLTVPRLAVWKFGKSGTKEDGTFTFKTYAEITPRASSKQLLLFIRKGRENSDGFDIIALDATGAGFGESQMLVMNLATSKVAGQVGGKRFILDPGKHVVFKPAADRGPKLCFAALRFQRDEEWRTFFSTNWPILEKARGLVFLYDDPRSKSVKIHSVVDSLLEIPDAD